MRKLAAMIYSEMTDMVASVDLPATEEELQERFNAIEDYEGNSVKASLTECRWRSGDIELWNDSALLNMIFIPKNQENWSADIYEINYLAEILSKMESTEITLLESIIKMQKTDNINLDISSFINLAMNVPYLSTTTKIKQLYDGKYPTPIPADYIFKFGISKAPTVENLTIEPKEEKLVELKLPATKERYMEVIKSTGATNLSDCTFYKFETAIPQFNGLWEFLDDLIEIESINDLALKITTMQQFNELPKYKAMLSTIIASAKPYSNPNIGLDIALNTFNLMSEFELNTTITAPSEYALLKLKSLDKAVTDELIVHLNLENYGKSIMENDGINLTTYGALIPNDGITLTEKMEQFQPQSPTMTMG